MTDETVWIEGPKLEEPIILNRVQEPLYEYVNVAEPVLENPEGEWWWIWTGVDWEPCLIVAVNGEPMIYCWGEDMENVSHLHLDDFDPQCRFTGPIPEPGETPPK